MKKSTGELSIELINWLSGYFYSVDRKVADMIKKDYIKYNGEKK
jgi:hemerythrin